MPLLVDLGNAPCHCTDHALESLYKSLAEAPSDDDGLWRPHENPWITDHIESVSGRAAVIIGMIQADLLGLLNGEMLRKSWLDDTGDYLSSKKPSEWTLDDWLLAVDWLFEKYLPRKKVDDEAEYLAVRSTLAGKLQAAATFAEEHARLLARALPIKIHALGHIAWVKPLDYLRLRFAKTRAAELMQGVADQTRSRIRKRILDYEERRVVGEPMAPAVLQSKLRDEFADMNRDWRRVAITESGRNCNESLIADIKPGERVKRQEAYKNACPFCAKINGMVFDVVSPNAPNKDGWKQVWIGKTNEGRSASPRKRVGNQLVERDPDELWWPAAGVQHPHCRGAWQVIAAPVPGANPEFMRWVDAELAKIKP